MQKEAEAAGAILPVWFRVTVDDVRRFSLPLADKVALQFDGSPGAVTSVAWQVLERARPDLFGRITRRRALVKAHDDKDLVSLESKDLHRTRIVEGPVFQEEIGLELLSRIRLVRACMGDLASAPMSEWIHDFQREPRPHREILTWEYIAAIHAELALHCSLKRRHRMLAHIIVLESTMFPDDLSERHAPLWRALPARARGILKRRMQLKPPYCE